MNHAQLQLQSMVTREQKVRSERDSLQYVVAEAEQDILLLEVFLFLFSIFSLLSTAEIVLMRTSVNNKRKFQFTRKYDHLDV